MFFCSAGYIVLLTGSTESARTILALRLFRVLRISKLLFRIKLLSHLLELAFSSVRTVLSLVFFLLFVMTLTAIISLHLFYACHNGDAAFQLTNFSTFLSAFLGIFQIVTGDNFGGIGAIRPAKSNT